MMTTTTRTLRDALAAAPTAPLAFLPTPLHEVPRFGEALGGPRILFKREDMTGLAMGGNKTRKLHFALGRAVEQGADVFIGGAGTAQSNHARQCAAAARALGMRPVLVLQYGPKEQQRMQGNLLLDFMLGAEVHFVPDEEVRKDVKPRFGLSHVMEEIAERYREQGHKPYVLPTSSVPEAAVGYVDGAVELHDQLHERNCRPTHLYITSTGSSLAGLMLGARALGREAGERGAAFEHVGISCGELTPAHFEAVARLFNGAAEQLGQPERITPDDVRLEPHGGEGYGILSEEAREATLLLARTEGVLVDPVYTAKGLAGLIADVRSGRLDKSDTVVFVHTGGFPAIFAYEDDLTAGYDYFASPPGAPGERP
jgi:1-aminocyclopropane-1-carboxylate deaminase/D-cysteine desulfhydrase-like pyridoxal-dependent ACC family enzyme